jgi:uncharacterized peroxidase-related enzyme
MRLPSEVQGRNPEFFGKPFNSWKASLHSWRSWDECQLIATAVSQANLAWRCVAGHRPAAVMQLSEELVAQALDERERGSLPPVRRALLEFAEQLTLVPETVSAATVARAIAAGASVDQLRDMVETTALMNVRNRITPTVDGTPTGG